MDFQQSQVQLKDDAIGQEYPQSEEKAQLQEDTLKTDEQVIMLLESGKQYGGSVQKAPRVYEVVCSLHKTKRNEVMVAKRHGLHGDMLIIKRSTLLPGRGRLMQYRGKWVPREFFFLQHIADRNLTPRLVDHWYEPGRASFLVMEYLHTEWRSLHHLVTTAGLLPPSGVAPIIRRLVKILIRLQKLSVYYLSTKPENVWVHIGSGAVCLLDLEEAVYNTDAHARSSSSLGTVGFCSPEMCFGLPYSLSKSQVFSVGCLVYACLRKEHAFCSIADTKAVQYDLGVKAVGEAMPEDAVEFIKRCLIFDPNRRTPLKKLLRHPWLKQ